jgi:hypothetical protein
MRQLNQRAERDQRATLESVFVAEFLAHPELQKMK